MEVKRRSSRSTTISSTSKNFRRILYGAIGVVLSSYVVLFILVVSRHIDQNAQDQLRRSVAESVASRDKGPPRLVGGLGPSLLGMERFHERWAAVARVLAANSETYHPAHPRRRVQMCTQPRFRRPPGPKIALASFPGSGNTWVRFLVQQATGLLTGSVYRDYSLKRNGFPAESVANGSVLLVKTHEWGERARVRYEKAVVLVREPYGALTAEFNRRAGGHVGHASPDKFNKGNGWHSFVISHSRVWMENTLDWLQFDGPLLVLRYETMTTDLPGELVKLLKFLDVNVTWSAFQCVIRNRDGIFRRAKKPLTFDPFNEVLKKVVESYRYIVDLAIKHREQGVIFDLNNATVVLEQGLPDPAVDNSGGGNGSVTVSMPLTYVEKDQTDSVS